MKNLKMMTILAIILIMVNANAKMHPASVLQLGGAIVWSLSSVFDDSISKFVAKEQKERLKYSSPALLRAREK